MGGLDLPKCLISLELRFIFRLVESGLELRLSENPDKNGRQTSHSNRLTVSVFQDTEPCQEYEISYLKSPEIRKIIVEKIPPGATATPY